MFMCLLTVYVYVLNVCKGSSVNIDVCHLCNCGYIQKLPPTNSRRKELRAAQNKVGQGRVGQYRAGHSRSKR